MKKQIFYITIFLLISFVSVSQENLSFFLPQDVEYDSSIPTPTEFLGYTPGEWHVSHDQLYFYLKELSKKSDRVIFREYARSHENRPLFVLIISSKNNLKNTDKIKERHMALSDGTFVDDADLDSYPLVLWLGYSIHGNEASGSNTALLLAYFLASAKGKYIDNILDNSVILLDPSYNPDGLQRFSTWVNMHRGKNPNPDANDREHNEVWPRGRTNHYWFDLNRDWLPVRHPESQGRVKLFHEWLPNLLTDHHEMGSFSTFFFQPGVPSRKNPLIPQRNLELTEKLAEHHAKALDKIGSLYFTKERFDDFYVGKGSTYPDINGSLGILFEQASVRGHKMNSAYQKLTFPKAIRNQLTTSFSSINGALALKKEFHYYRRNYFLNVKKESGTDPTFAYVYGADTNLEKTDAFTKLLLQHNIQVHELNADIETEAHRFSTENSYMVPLEQKKYRLIKTIFETQKHFTDSLFYDVSTWTLPLAFNIPYKEVKRNEKETLGEPISNIIQKAKKINGDENSLAFAIKPSYYAYKAVYKLMRHNVQVTVLHKTHHAADNQSFERGTIIIPMYIQSEKREQVFTLLKEIAAQESVEVFELTSGLARSGIDLGSNNNEMIHKPSIALLVGEGVNAYEAGEVWHLLSHRFDIDVTLLPIERISKVNLDAYNRIVMVNGRYSTLGEKEIKGLKTWVKKGNILIGWKNAAKKLSSYKIAKTKFVETKVEDEEILYEKLSSNKGAQIIGGSIFEATLDLSHPLCYGYTREHIPLFRNHTLIFDKPDNLYASPIRYTESSLLSGYVSEENVKAINHSYAAHISNLGDGKVILLSDNPNFRAFWYGTNRLFLNALFLGGTIHRNAAD